MDEHKLVKFAKNNQTIKTTSNWIKHIIAGIAGASISFATTFGIMNKNSADIAKQHLNVWLNKTEDVCLNNTALTLDLAQIQVLIEAKQYILAIQKLNKTLQQTKNTIITIKELNKQIKQTIDEIK